MTPDRPHSLSLLDTAPAQAATRPVARRSGRLFLAALGLIVLAAAGVRLLDLNRRTITHPEVYTPGIELPPDLVEFSLPRLTLPAVVTAIVRIEPHPPLFYVSMLAWTKVCGTSEFALRLPSALFGIASVLLVGILGMREKGAVTGLTAAGMLALNGQNVLWSQTSRMYALACVLGLVSTLLLLRVARGESRLLGSLLLYCISTVAGTATVIFYWPIFITQILWVAGKTMKRPALLPLLRWQLLTFVMASPFIALAAHQSWRPSYAVGKPSDFLGQFLQFGFLFEPHELQSSLSAPATAATILLALAALFLLAVGLSSRSVVEVERADLVVPGPPPWLWVSVELVALALILGLGGASYVLAGKMTAKILATASIPVSGPLLDLLLRRYWPRLQEKTQSTPMPLTGGWASLSGLLAVVPVMLILAVSPVIPLFASRGASLYVPYLLVIAAHGMVVLVRRDLRWLVLSAALLAAHVASVNYFYHRPASPRDYKALARELTPRVKESDLIVVQGNDWQTTPIFYYLRADRYHFIGKNYSEEIAKRPDARVWVVIWVANNMTRDMVHALRDYDRGEEVEVWGARAVLYTPRSNKSMVSGSAALDQPSNSSARSAPTVLYAREHRPASGVPIQRIVLRRGTSD